jgi:hypothetical protein
LKVVASNDLKGLGANDGSPVAYAWTLPSLLPQFLPWLAVLGLLLLKPNRTARAWWIWLPLVAVVGIERFLSPLFEGVPSQVLDVLGMVFNSLAFGFAGAWLLATWLCHRLRFLVLLKTLLAVATLSAFAFLVRQDWGEPGMAAGFLIYVGLCGLVLVAALSLAGLLCRRRYRPVALALWLALLVAACWMLIAAPFLIVLSVMSHVGPSWLEVILALLAFAGLTFAVVLPFLILAFANGLFRERLKDLLHLRPASPPAVPVAPPPILNAGIQI